MNNTIAEFIDSVEKMRNLQIAYFRTRLPSALVSAKEQENKVDKFIKMHRQNEVQHDLFPKEEVKKS
jgi:hypothetical protein